MQALRYLGKSELAWEEVPDPQPGPEDVIVRPIAVSLCDLDPLVITADLFPGRFVIGRDEAASLWADHRPQASTHGVLMKMTDIPFEVTNWDQLERAEHSGASGRAYWRTQFFGDVRVRMVEYSANYLADHWCDKGHILLCLTGELRTDLEGGDSVTLTPGMSYQVGDKGALHRSRTEVLTTLFIVD